MATLPPPDGGWSRRDILTPKMVRYLRGVVEVQTELPIRHRRELLSLAQSIDALLQGDLTFAADTLMARFRAVESSAAHGWDVAQELELTPAERLGTTSDGDLRRASRAVEERSKLSNLLSRTRAPPPASSNEAGRGRSETRRRRQR